MSQAQNLMHNVEAEREVVAACLYEDVFEAIRDRLHKELFVDLGCIKAYDIICDIVREGKNPELTEVGMRLVSVGENPTNYMLDGYPSLEITNQRICLLEEMKMRREVYNLCYRGMALSNNPVVAMDDIYRLQADLNDLISGKKEGEIRSYQDVTNEVLNNVAKRLNGKAEQGIMTGLHIFDSHYGFHRGDLIVIAGETSQGKSTLATTIARNVARNNIAVAYYSMEMSATQLAARIMSGDTQVPSSQILYGQMKEQDYNLFYTRAKAIGELPIYFDERSKTSFTKMCTSIRKMVKAFNVQIVFIDYLQILANGGRDNREQIIGDMARDLKRLAVELDICIVALSQLARAAGNQSKEPTISRMRGSGQIEEACDMAILIYRPSIYGVKRYNSGQSTEDSAKLYIAKGRNIGLATEVVKFNAALSFFADYEQGDPRAPYQEQTEKLPF